MKKIPVETCQPSFLFVSTWATEENRDWHQDENDKADFVADAHFVFRLDMDMIENGQGFNNCSSLVTYAQKFLICLGYFCLSYTNDKNGGVYQPKSFLQAS